MNKLLLKAGSLIVCCSLLIACSAKIIPVRGDYASLPVTFKSDKSVDAVWDRLVDLFAQNGLSIKLIDRSSGLIVSDNSTLIATWEDKDGKPLHENAHIVVPKKYNASSGMQVGITKYTSLKSELKKPDVVKGEWNVRIKQDGSGSIVNVNLVNVTYEDNNIGSSHTIAPDLFRSTGKFEQGIAELIR